MEIGAYAWIMMLGSNGWMRGLLADIGIELPPIYGMFGILLVSAPWFVYMTWTFGRPFVDFYFLHENLSLYARPVFGPAASTTYFVPILAVGLLPWTPILAGRVIDAARRRACSTEERVLWAWNVAVFGFFSFSHFKLDHYVFPAAPALCLRVDLLPPLRVVSVLFFRETPRQSSSLGSHGHDRLDPHRATRREIRRNDCDRRKDQRDQPKRCDIRRADTKEQA
jgi:hypothetical protein